nr:hypothetical protein [Tanacetum cinerariifolium]
MVLIVKHGPRLSMSRNRATIKTLAANISLHTLEPSRRFNSFYDDDDKDDYEESTNPLNEIISQIPPSIAITPVLPTMEPKDSIIIGNEELSTIPEKKLDEVKKSSVENLVSIPKGKSVTFSNPLFDSNDDFTSSDDESLSDEDVLEDKVKIYSNPLFEFDDVYISSDVNHLFDEVLENIENKDSYDSNLDEPDLLVTPLFDANEDECLDPGGDVDEIELLLHHDLSTPKMSVASILEGFTDEPPLEENDDLFDLESKENKWKKILYDAPVNDLMIEDKVFDPGILKKKISPTYVIAIIFSSHMLSEFFFLISLIRWILLFFSSPGVCESYVRIVDSFIANKRSKVGKRFGFVRFMGVQNKEAFAKLLSSIWIGSFHLFAYVARFQRQKIAVENPPKETIKVAAPGLEKHSVNSMKVALAKVKSVKTMSTMYRFCREEGFNRMKIHHVGGLWLWFQFQNVDSCTAFKNKTNLKTLFTTIKSISRNFYVDEIMVWVEISGLPLYARGSNAFKKVGDSVSKFMFFEDDRSKAMSMGRVCITTKQLEFISEVVKVAIHGEAYEVHIYELGSLIINLDDASHNSKVDSKVDVASANEEESECEGDFHELYQEDQVEKLYDDKCEMENNEESNQSNAPQEMNEDEQKEVRPD